MSRVAKAGVELPTNVELKFDDATITVKGPKGTLTEHKNKLVKVSTSADNDKVINFTPASNEQEGWAQAGTACALVRNMVKGVTEGFTKTLELVGVGYRVQVSGTKLTLSLGYTNPVVYNLPTGITAEAPSNTVLKLSGSSKQTLGQVAAEIRSLRPPEPYKGKGIKYADEIIIRKEAKKK